MKKLQKVIIIAWVIHLVLLGTYIAGNKAGEALANDLIPQTVSLKK